MRTFDWQKLLDEQHIDYVDRGPNVKRGELNIRCPFCGSADPSHHLGLSLTTGWWACWRNENHRGKSPVRLLVQLLKVSYWRAREIAGLSDDYVDPDGFDAVAARVMGRESKTDIKEIRRDHLRYYPEFDSLTARSKGSGMRFRRHIAYLVNERGFPEREVTKIAEQYHLQAANAGSFGDRIIFPYFLNHELVAWTGRAISTSTIRYKDLSLEECLTPIKSTFYNHDCILEGGKVLLIVEGPMDVIKLDYYGQEYGVRAVGLSTSSITEQQMFLLEESTSKFKKVIIMRDSSSQLDIVASMTLRDRISHIPGLQILAVPYGYKDGGEMPPRKVVQFSREVVL